MVLPVIQLPGGWFVMLGLPVSCGVLRLFPLPGVVISPPPLLGGAAAFVLFGLTEVRAGVAGVTGGLLLGFD